MCEVFKGRPNKLVKPAKVPSWSKDMKLDAYLKALEVWMEMNKDVSEAVRFQDVIESLKTNKEIEGLAKYVGEHVIARLDTIEKHKVKEITDLLKLKYGENDSKERRKASNNEIMGCYMDDDRSQEKERNRKLSIGRVKEGGKS